MKKSLLLSIALSSSILLSAQTLSTFHDFSGKTILGDSIDFSIFHGKKVMVVNTASLCGYTHQYADLQELYANYQQYDFEIIGFPCNDFSNQEPGYDSTIYDFCQSYNVTFQMMSKIATVSTDTVPVYKWLQRANLNGVQDASVSWNFNKFLIDEAGHWVRHFEAPTNPLDTAITNWIMSPSVLSVKDKLSVSDLSVFPNPSNGNVCFSYQLVSPEEVTHTLTDISGRVVFSETQLKSSGLIKSSVNLVVNSLSAGVYLINIKVSGQVSSKKLVVIE
jgi:glutathione peroxidase